MISNPIGVLCRALTLGLMFPLLAQADPASGPGPDARPQTDCGSLIKKAEASLPKMHNGVGRRRNSPGRGRTLPRATPPAARPM